MRYKHLEIPQIICDFFKSQDELSIELLYKLMDEKLAISPEYGELIFDTNMGFESESWAQLLHFYHSNPDFSITKLFSFDELFIANIINSDRELKFHHWLYKNHLTLPCDLESQQGFNIKELTGNSGIEFLNRKILSLPKKEQQDTFNHLERRFNQFRKQQKQIEVDFTALNQLKVNSLFWQSAKKVAEFSSNENEMLPLVCQTAVDTAKKLQKELAEFEAYNRSFRF